MSGRIPEAIEAKLPHLPETPGVYLWRDAGGTVWCWGLNDQGQIGNGARDDAEPGSPLPNVDGGVAQVASGVNPSCVALENGTVRCWNRLSTRIPTPINGLSAATAVTDSDAVT